jgi:glutathione S-transferase
VTAAKPVPLQLGMTIDSTDARGAGPAVQLGNQFGGYDRGKAGAPESRAPTPVAPPEPARDPVRTDATVVKKVSGEYTRAALRANIEGRLSKGDWIVGDAPSAADVAIFPCIRVLHRALLQPGARELASRFLPAEVHYPQLARWLRRVEALPGFERTLPSGWHRLEG